MFTPKAMCLRFSNGLNSPATKMWICLMRMRQSRLRPLKTLLHLSLSLLLNRAHLHLRRQMDRLEVPTGWTRHACVGTAVVSPTCRITAITSTQRKQLGALAIGAGSPGTRALIARRNDALNAVKSAILLVNARLPNLSPNMSERKSPAKSPSLRLSRSNRRSDSDKGSWADMIPKSRLFRSAPIWTRARSKSRLNRSTRELSSASALTLLRLMRRNLPGLDGRAMGVRRRMRRLVRRISDGRSMPMCRRVLRLWSNRREMVRHMLP